MLTTQVEQLRLALPAGAAVIDTYVSTKGNPKRDYVSEHLPCLLQELHCCTRLA